MARQRFGPQHSIVGEAVFVPQGDGAWNLELVGKEVVELRKGTPFEKLGTAGPSYKDKADPAHDHPFYRYHAGKTRYDIMAESIRAYLDESKRPEKYRLKRMTWDTRAAVFRLQTERKLLHAQALAFLEGVVGCENVDASLEGLLKQREKGIEVSDDDIIEAATRVAYEVIGDAGTAVIGLSRDLDEEEKKIT